MGMSGSRSLLGWGGYVSGGECIQRGGYTRGTVLQDGTLPQTSHWYLVAVASCSNAYISYGAFTRNQIQPDIFTLKKKRPII